jgi:hypothetical protein
MKTYTVSELNAILKAHGEWLKDNLKGKRANLNWANLSSADLCSANLSSANLCWANLSSADLSSANLSSANLCSANLCSANLSSANLSGANLREKIISISRIGSRKDMTHYNYDKDIVFCGCWKGTLEEFEKRIKEAHKDNPQYLKEYTQAIKFFKSLK